MPPQKNEAKVLEHFEAIAKGMGVEEPSKGQGKENYMPLWEDDLALANQRFQFGDLRYPRSNNASRYVCVEHEGGAGGPTNFAKYLALLEAKKHMKIRLLHLYEHEEDKKYPRTWYQSHRLLEEWLKEKLGSRFGKRFAAKIFLWPSQSEKAKDQFRKWMRWLKA